MGSRLRAEDYPLPLFLLSGSGHKPSNRLLFAAKSLSRPSRLEPSLARSPLRLEWANPMCTSSSLANILAPRYLIPDIARLDSFLRIRNCHLECPPTISNITVRHRTCDLQEFRSFVSGRRASTAPESWARVTHHLVNHHSHTPTRRQDDHRWHPIQMFSATTMHWSRWSQE